MVWYKYLGICHLFAEDFKGMKTSLVHKLIDVIIIDKEGVNISYGNDVETSSGGFMD